MNKQNLVDAFREISTLESNRYKSLAYLNACKVIEDMTNDEFESRKSFLSIKGIGMSINTKILDFKKDGTLPAKLYKLREENKSYLDPMLYKVRKGFITKRLPYDKAKEIADSVVEYLMSEGIDGMKIHILGSFRRKKPMIADFDILFESENDYVSSIKSLEDSNILTTVVKGPAKTTFVFNNTEKTTLDVTWVAQESLPFSILHFTGSAASNIRLRAIAKTKGYTLNQYGLFPIDKEDTKAKNDLENFGKITKEKQIFIFLGVPYVEPENR